MPSTTEPAHDDTDSVAPRADRPVRRRFSPDYKLLILAEHDRLTGSGEKGALLRREGLYSSHIVEWRRARDAGILARPGTGPVPPGRASDAAGLVKANRKVARLEAELDRTKMALSIMGKTHALLGMFAESADYEPKPTS
ncbi:MAG: hypothetical protein M3R71_03670 [Actinomycetota bacterium]|nr:hypothetical protein [Actinomycetota bacterium]